MAKKVKLTHDEFLKVILGMLFTSDDEASLVANERRSEMSLRNDLPLVIVDTHQGCTGVVGVIGGPLQVVLIDRDVLANEPANEARGFIILEEYAEEETQV